MRQLCNKQKPSRLNTVCSLFGRVLIRTVRFVFFVLTGFIVGYTFSAFLVRLLVFAFMLCGTSIKTFFGHVFFFTYAACNFRMIDFKMKREFIFQLQECCHSTYC